MVQAYVEPARSPGILPGTALLVWCLRYSLPVLIIHSGSCCDLWAGDWLLDWWDSISTSSFPGASCASGASAEIGCGVHRWTGAS